MVQSANLYFLLIISSIHVNVKFQYKSKTSRSMFLCSLISERGSWSLKIQKSKIHTMENVSIHPSKISKEDIERFKTSLQTAVLDVDVLTIKGMQFLKLRNI